MNCKHSYQKFKARLNVDQPQKLDNYSPTLKKKTKNSMMILSKLTSKLKEFSYKKDQYKNKWINLILLSAQFQPKP